LAITELDKIHGDRRRLAKWPLQDLRRAKRRSDRGDPHPRWAIENLIEIPKRR